MLGDIAPLRQDYLLSDFLADTGRYELVGSVHIEAVPRDAGKEVEWLAGLAAISPIPSAFVARAELNDSKVEALLAAHSAVGKVRGIRQIVNWHANPGFTFTPSDLLADTAWLGGFRLLRKYGLSFDLQLYPGQMQDAAALARANPDTAIIVNHTGMPIDRDPASLALWRVGIKALAACDNVAMKVSGLGMLDHRWTIEGIRPFVREAIAAFGVDRAMFGSNFPVDRLYSTFDGLYAAFEQIVADLPEADQDKLFRANAMHWYRLK
jgi:predicted TIM-barrel fold metal-dependent hydrolase